MAATRKPKKTEPLKEMPRAKEPTWVSPRTPLPVIDFTPQAKQSLLEKAWAVAGPDAAPEIIAALIVAQACDRLGEKLVEAAAVGRYRGP